MSEKSTPAPSGSAASGANGASGASQAAQPSSAAVLKKPVSEGNPAFRMMGLPRLRLPSRNWMIFLSITGSFASAVIYDKYQTRRIREKWCNLVSHIADEHLDTHQLPRRMTIYLAAPPGDGLRTAREHFHTYVKPVLVAAAMDWDVVEGRKEGDVRHKTGEKIRKKRRKAGEGKPEEEEEGKAFVETIRQHNGTKQFEGVAGDLVIGRHTWKEYVRGLHEGWLGPADAPVPTETETPVEAAVPDISPGHSSIGDAAVKAAASVVATPQEGFTSDESAQKEVTDDAPLSSDFLSEEAKKKEEEKKEEEKPKPRQPPPYILPTEYSTANVSSNIPESIDPSIGIRMPHLLGFRNTPIRIYRFLNRRSLADSIGRDVAAAILASHRPYDSVVSTTEDANGSSQSEVQTVLAHEERDWWKTTYKPREEHEESVWIEDMYLDERIAARMRQFELTPQDDDRAKRLFNGTEKVKKVEEDAD